MSEERAVTVIIFFQVTRDEELVSGFSQSLQTMTAQVHEGNYVVSLRGVDCDWPETRSLPT
jgi:hypothetical protein